MIRRQKNDSDNTDVGIDVSIVMPCLNEAKTIVQCIREANDFFENEALRGEVVVADNGSTDDSVSLARDNGAIVVHASEKGYGNACRVGMNAARGKYVFKMDADGTYVCDDITDFLIKFEDGYDYVIGSRLRGKILPGAMPFSHRYIGNPVMSIMAQILCMTGISDICCGLKGFKKTALDGLEFQSHGMVFGPETTIKSRQHGLSIAEVPITYRPDKRDSHTNLRRYRDGINNVVFILRERFIFRKYQAN